MPLRSDEDPRSELVRRLRAAGCVFAEDEAEALLTSAEDAEELEQMVVRRLAGEPLEAIVGWAELGGLRLSVGPGVFVPRQRSLLLVSVAVAAATATDAGAPVVVEPFCGVAPIAASVLAAVPDAECHVCDIDAVALVHARRNLPSSAGVHRGDGLAALPPGVRGRVTVLAGVPPYVPTSAAVLLPREALDHEPEVALLGGSDGLDHVRRLVDDAGPWLAPEGRVLVEINRAQLPAAAEHARRAGYAVRSHSGDDGHTTVLDLQRDPAAGRRQRPGLT